MKPSKNLRKMSPRDRLLTLRTLAGFRNLSLSELVPFSQLMNEAEFREGDLLLKAGEPIERGQIILSGRVALVRDGEQLDVLEPPAGVGLLGILTNQNGPRGDVVALEPTTGFSVDASSMLRLYESDFRYIRNSIWIAAQIVLEARRGLPYDPVNPPVAEMGPEVDGEMDLVDQLIWMADGIWETANLEAIAELTRAQKQIFYPAGELLWEQGDASRFMVQIRHGLMSVKRTSEDSCFNGVVGYKYTAGLFEGLAREPRTYTARAQTDLWVVQSEVDDFLTVLEDHFDMAMTALSTLATNALDLLWSTRSDVIPGNVVRLPVDRGSDYSVP
jgi:CRP-like cAMP-binding protein